jgi:hypothetical protein
LELIGVLNNQGFSVLSFLGFKDSELRSSKVSGFKKLRFSVKRFLGVKVSGSQGI